MIAQDSTPSEVIAALQKLLGEDAVCISETDRLAFSYDGTSRWQGIPDFIVFPTNTEQVAEIMKYAGKWNIPVTIRGAGTNLSGGSVPAQKGMVLCTSRMNRIQAINPVNFTVTVDAGVVLNNMNMAIAKYGLFFPPDPQSFLAATIGGCVAENSGGPYALKYGIFKHYLLGLKAVLANGTIVSLGGQTMKNVTGYDLTSLICGSEGTLAVVTEVTLRLISAPPAKQTILAVFNETAQAGQAVNEILSKGVLPAKIEIMDNWIIRRIEEVTPLGLPVDAEAILLFELNGHSQAISSEVEQIMDLCRNFGAPEVKAAQNQKEADNFWTARRAGFSAIFGNSPTVLAEDVTVPINQIPTLINEIKQIGNRYDIQIVIIGHAGDGNLHPCILTDKENQEHFNRAESVAGEIFQTAINMGGVISGEHGIGMEKKKYLKYALQPEVIELHRQIKHVFDPQGILNPGKIWE